MKLGLSNRNISCIMKHKLKTIVIDHSATQRKLLTNCVQQSSDLDLVDEIGFEKELNDISNLKNADLLLMDVEFPGLNQIDFLHLIDSGVQIILVTATASFALKAFDMGVTDYILKPVKKSRLEEAIAKAWVHYSIIKKPKRVEEFIKVKSDHDYKQIPLSQIRWIEALGDYVKIITNHDRILVLSTLSSIEQQLPGNKFLRIHRSYIVNLDKVENFSSTSVEVEGSNIPMSRKRKSRLEAKLIPDFES